MRRRKLLVALAGLAAVGVIVLCSRPDGFVLWSRPNRVTRENYDRIHIGMGRTEVEAILGPPGDYMSQPAAADITTLTFDRPEGGGQAYWASETGAIGIMFDRKGSVAQTGFVAPAPIQLGPLDTLLWRIKRLWLRVMIPIPFDAAPPG
jgi:hypothetical protein